MRIMVREGQQTIKPVCAQVEDRNNPTGLFILLPVFNSPVQLTEFLILSVEPTFIELT